MNTTNPQPESTTTNDSPAGGQTLLQSRPSLPAGYELKQITERAQEPVVIERKWWGVEYRNPEMWETEKWALQGMRFPAERLAARWFSVIDKLSGDEFRIVEVVERKTVLVTYRHKATAI